MARPNQADVVVIGAGHNGLITAALLARQGKQVVLLEKREVVGGIAGIPALQVVKRILSGR